MCVQNICYCFFFLGSSHQNSDNRTTDNNETEQSTSEENKMETETSEEVNEKESATTRGETTLETTAVIEHNPSTSQNEGESPEKVPEEEGVVSYYF